jgi:hypothetical protein
MKIENAKRYADKGTLVHSMLAIFYTIRALNPTMDRYKAATTTIQLLKKNKFIQKAGFDKDFEQLMLDRFNQYLFRYHVGDFVPTIRNGVVGVETPFAMKLYEDAEKVFILEGRIDLLSANQHFPFFVDHKTQLRFSELYARKIQFACYSLATGYQNGLINYFGLQKEYKENRTLRQKPIFIPKDYSEYFKDYLIRNVFQKIFEIRSGKAVWTPNLNSCSGNFESWPCDFAQVCEQRQNPEVQELLKRQFYMKVEPWSPWNDSAGADDFEPADDEVEAA